ncbi:MAG: peptidoglycan synthetase, partial [Flavobacteriia bacterium]|nr:peptidoglycan synthetase [Flavobacteriia bacterium]
MNIHFIAIGGSAMHNLAIALHRKGHAVSGSDDEILDPSKSRLEKEGILPAEIGWLIPVFSYPEYLFEASKSKKRVVIAGSHGKTTITSMILHVVQKLQMNVDYMVGAQLEGYDCMVKITDEAEFMLLEGDEYLSSPIDRRPKFHLYHPHFALLSGIAWDHINVFPTFENYVEQFQIFVDSIQPDGCLVFNNNDPEIHRILERPNQSLALVPYGVPDYDVSETGVILRYQGKDFKLQIFGDHNLQNLMGAARVGEMMGIEIEDFFRAMSDFRGA